eukprot:scaffold21750_cov128-Isochrysis_galbana.AAC.15
MFAWVVVHARAGEWEPTARGKTPSAGRVLQLCGGDTRSKEREQGAIRTPEWFAKSYVVGDNGADQHESGADLTPPPARLPSAWAQLPLSHTIPV